MARQRVDAVDDFLTHALLQSGLLHASRLPYTTLPVPPLMPPHDTPAPFKSRGGWRRLIQAARYSLAGYRAAFTHEAAFRQELFVVALLTPCAFWLGESLRDVAILLATLVGVLVVELLNSAIEALADAISTDHHPLLGRAKDLGSAAVMLSLLLAAGVWIAMLVARLMP